MNKFLNYMLILLLLFAITSCKNTTKTNVDKNKDKKVELPEFDSDSAFSYIADQISFGPRVPNSQAHALCASYLSIKLKNYCDTVINQKFITTAYTGEKLKCTNIIASINIKNTKRIILSSHWDSRPLADRDPNLANHNKPIDGANDGASGVGILIEIARQLQKQKPTIGIDIILFDAEDFGTPDSENKPGDWWCLGSQYWAKNLHIKGYRAEYGILLDMVGAPNATFYHEGISAYYAQHIIRKVWGKANRLGLGNYFINSEYHPVTDDHYYINKITGIPVIDIIHQDKSGNTGFYPYWHTLEDNLNKIDKYTLFVVGTTLLSVIRDEK